MHVQGLFGASVATSNGDNYCIIWSQNKNIGSSCPLFQKLFLQSSCLGTTELLPAIQLGYEIRSTTVHEKMMEMWKSNFIVKTVSKSKVWKCGKVISYIHVCVSSGTYIYAYDVYSETDGCEISTS